MYKRCLFAQMQETAGEDAEKAFGVLETRWTIVCGAAMSWDSMTVQQVMICHVILHKAECSSVDFDLKFTS
jgi:hypothetical protein